MSAFKEAFNSMSSSTSAPSNLNIKGSAGPSNGAPSTRGLANALRSAGMSRPARGGQPAEGMEVDTVGRPARGKHARGARADPLSQAGRQPGPRGTHARRNSDSGPRSLADRLGSSSGAGSSKAGVELMPPVRGRGASHTHGTKHHKGRLPAGTPEMLRVKDHKEVERARRDQVGRVTEVFRSEEFKGWLRARNVGEGMMDMSGLPDDAFLKEHNIESIGSRTAASNTGALLWKLILVNIEDQRGPIRFFSLNNNHLSSLRQLERLPTTLTHITALDLSNNPIASLGELSYLQARSEQKGKPNAGRGSMKNLTELKLVGCAFREEMLAKPNGAETYQHEILRRFPGLKMLDGEYLTRLVFPIDRQPVHVYDEAERKRMAASPYTFPCDVQGSFEENPAIKDVVMRFCAKYFPLWDTNRRALVPAYAPSATFSISANPIASYSYAAQLLEQTKHTRPRTSHFGPYTSLPGRNFLRHATSINERMQTLKSAAQPEEMVKFWEKIPMASHPLTEADKWVFDSYVLDMWTRPEGGEMATAMLTVQGQFQEFDGPKSYRSFSRTFVLITVSDDSAAAKEGWPCQILSDTLIIHPFLSNTAYDPQTRSLIGDGVEIQPPAPVAPAATQQSTNVNTANLPQALQGLSPEQVQIAQQLSSVTGMNAQYSVLCLQGNGFDYERALANFGEIRGTIPAEAFQA